VETTSLSRQVVNRHAASLTCGCKNVELVSTCSTPACDGEIAAVSRQPNPSTSARHFPYFGRSGSPKWTEIWKIYICEFLSVAASYLTEEPEIRIPGSLTLAPLDPRRLLTS
jgi:hypothetical protein